MVSGTAVNTSDCGLSSQSTVQSTPTPLCRQRLSTSHRAHDALLAASSVDVFNFISQIEFVIFH